MKEEQINEYCERIASYLICEGLFYSKYNIDEANDLLDKTCLPTALKRHLKENEEKIKNMLYIIEKLRYERTKKRRTSQQRRKTTQRWK